MTRLALFMGAEVAVAVGLIALWRRYWREVVYRGFAVHPLDDLPVRRDDEP